MCKRTKKKKNKKISTRAVIFICLIPIGLFAACFGLMKWGDVRYAFFESVVNGMRDSHHFDGSIWYTGMITIVAAIIAAIPGIICGILALVQSQRLHELEDRYHLPVFTIQNISLRAREIEADYLTSIVFQEREEVKRLQKSGWTYDFILEISFQTNDNGFIGSFSLDEIHLSFGKSYKEFFFDPAVFLNDRSKKGEKKKGEKKKGKKKKGEKKKEKRDECKTTDYFFTDFYRKCKNGSVLYTYKKRLNALVDDDQKDNLEYTYSYRQHSKPEFRYMFMTCQFSYTCDYRSGQRIVLCTYLDMDERKDGESKWYYFQTSNGVFVKLEDKKKGIGKRNSK